MSRRRGGIGGAGALLFVGLCFALAAAHTDEEVRIDVGGPISISKEGSQPSEHFEFVFPKTIKTFYVPRKSYWRLHEVLSKFRTELVVEVTEVSGCPLYVFTRDSMRTRVLRAPYEATPAPVVEGQKEKRWLLHMSPLGGPATINVACGSEKNNLARYVKKALFGTLKGAIKGEDSAEKENVFSISVTERRTNKYPQFLAAGAVILALSGYLAHSVTFYYVASVGSIVAVLSLGIFYLAYRSLSRRSDRRALGKTFGALSLGLAWVFNKGWDYFVYWYTQTLIWPLQQLKRYVFSNQPGSGYVAVAAAVVVVLSAGLGTAFTRRYLVEVSKQNRTARVKDGPETFVLWVLRSAAVILLTQSSSDPWVGLVVAAVVLSVITGWVYSVAHTAQKAAQNTAHVVELAMSPLAALRSPATAGKDGASARRQRTPGKGPTPDARRASQGFPGFRGKPAAAATSQGTPNSLDPDPDTPAPPVPVILFFGRTPVSKAEAEKVAKETTKEELARLASSPEFRHFVAENAWRMSLSPLPRGLGKAADDDEDEGVNSESDGE